MVEKNKLITPPQINPCEFVLNKINWRYEKGKPVTNDSAVVFGDSTQELRSIATNATRNDIKFSLLFTSPPYCSVTDYHKDQWLRLWLLGSSEDSQMIAEKHKGRFVNKQDYYDLLDNVFGLCSNMMADKSTIYVRTDKRDYTFNSTLEVLKKHYPNYNVSMIEKPLTKDTRTQTKLYGDKSMKPGEVDIILKS